MKKISFEKINKRFKIAPRFTVVHHPIRLQFDLSFAEYALIDSIDQLSHSPKYPYCVQSKSDLAAFLGISERHAFRAVKAGLEKGLLEKNDQGQLRSTDLWVCKVRLYDNTQDTNID